MPIANALSKVSAQGKVKIKGLDVTIYELIPYLTTVYVEQI